MRYWSFTVSMMPHNATVLVLPQTQHYRQSQFCHTMVQSKCCQKMLLHCCHHNKTIAIWHTILPDVAITMLWQQCHYDNAAAEAVKATQLHILQRYCKTEHCDEITLIIPELK